MAEVLDYSVRKVCKDDLDQLVHITDMECWNQGLAFHQSYHALNPLHAYVAVMGHHNKQVVLSK